MLHNTTNTECTPSFQILLQCMNISISVDLPDSRLPNRDQIYRITCVLDKENIEKKTVK